jgi:hypothetical protein
MVLAPAKELGSATDLAKRAAVTFDDTISYLFQLDIFQNNGTAVSAFVGQVPAGPYGLSAGDL